MESPVTLHEMRKVVDRAAACQMDEQAESGWNNLVHTPLLDASLAPAFRRHRFIDFYPWYVCQGTLLCRT
jgi:hypothetical protein